MAEVVRVLRLIVTGRLHGVKMKRWQRWRVKPSDSQILVA
jgi:hypothetical protein